ncbi:MAG: hypothetical protein GY804_10545 [Alphaproteobacteria bacterium]|nr:hypothetical protein [Alphaproteobacteria bacterium]
MNKASVIEHIDILIRTHEIHKILRDKDDDLGNQTLDLISRLFRFYDFVVDDVIIIGAFERYLKACLLRDGYVVHIIKKGKLNKQQKNKPISTKELQDANNESSSVTIEDNKTIGCASLLKDEYFKLNPLEDEYQEYFNDIQNNRNKIHFSGTSFFHNGGNLRHLNAIQHLYETIKADMQKLPQDVIARVL